MKFYINDRFWIILQASLFNVLWYLSVVGGNDWLIFSVSIIAIHLMISPSKYEDAKIIFIALLGIAVDFILLMSGVFVFDEFPYWLVILWCGFVLNLGHSLRVLKRFSIFWLVLVGGFSGVYAYTLSWKLGAVQFSYGFFITAVILFLIWSVLIPSFVKLDNLVRA